MNCSVMDSTKVVKVLHITKELGSGGIESVVCNLLHNINLEKIHFDFAIHGNGLIGMHEDEVLGMGCKIYRFRNLRKCKSVRNYQKQWKEFWELYKEEYDIVHVHYMSHAGMIVESAKKYGKVTIAHSHSTKNPKIQLLGLYKKYLKRKLVDNTDYMLACSKAAGIDYFGKVFTEKGGKVLKNAIVTSDFVYRKDVRMRLREQYHIDTRYVIGHVGNYVAHKNQDFMLEIFSEVVNRDKNAYLVWAGVIDEKEKEHVNSLLCKLGIREHVLLLGRCENVNEWMSAFDVFLFPSLYEGLGIVLIEAQAAGLKCVTSDTIPEEALVTELVTVCELTDCCGKWAEKVLCVDTEDRQDMTEQIKIAGYDVRESAEWMCDYYLRIYDA